MPSNRIRKQSLTRQLSKRSRRNRQSKRSRRNRPLRRYRASPPEFVDFSITKLPFLKKNTDEHVFRQGLFFRNKLGPEYNSLVQTNTISGQGVTFENMRYPYDNSRILLRVVGHYAEKLYQKHTTTIAHSGTNENYTDDADREYFVHLNPVLSEEVDIESLKHLYGHAIKGLQETREQSVYDISLLSEHTAIGYTTILEVSTPKVEIFQRPRNESGTIGQRFSEMTTSTGSSVLHRTDDHTFFVPSSVPLEILRKTVIRWCV